MKPGPLPALLSVSTAAAIERIFVGIKDPEFDRPIHAFKEISQTCEITGIPVGRQLLNFGSFGFDEDDVIDDRISP